MSAQLATKLGFYKLRAKVSVENLTDKLGALAVWDGTPETQIDLSFADPRDARLGWRILIPQDLAEKAAKLAGADLADEAAYDAHRIACGVPRGGLDFGDGDAFPHETNMDLLNGVAFDKGCYIGQEVVSRMQHRGLVRKRVLKVAIDGEAAPGAEIRAGEIAVGVLGGAQGGRGLATLRLDRLEDSNGAPLAAGDVLVSVLDRAPQGSP